MHSFSKQFRWSLGRIKRATLYFFRSLFPLDVYAIFPFWPTFLLITHWPSIRVSINKSINVVSMWQNPRRFDASFSGSTFHWSDFILWDHSFREGAQASLQGCQMAYFQTKNSNLGKFWRSLQWTMLAYLMDIGLFYGHLIYFMPFGIFCGNLVYFSPCW
jgi:hypothetical protein